LNAAIILTNFVSPLKRKRWRKKSLILQRETSNFRSK